MNKTRSWSRFALACGAAVTVAVGCLGTTSTAEAATNTSSTGDATAPAGSHLNASVVEQPYVSGFNTAIAAKAGFVVHALPDGALALFKAKDVVAARARLGVAAGQWTASLTVRLTPVAVVDAPGTPGVSDAARIPAAANTCGEDFLELYSFPGQNGKYQEETGFKGSIPAAISYAWSETISVTDNSGSINNYVVKQSGGLALDTNWTGQHTATDTKTPLALIVYSAGSYLQADGVTCYASGDASTVIVPGT